MIADPIGRLIWASPALPGASHDMGAPRDHGILDALTVAAAQLKSWRILRKIRCCPRRATVLVKTVLVLILAG